MNDKSNLERTNERTTQENITDNLKEFWTQLNKKKKVECVAFCIYSIHTVWAKMFMCGNYNAFQFSMHI